MIAQHLAFAEGTNRAGAAECELLAGEQVGRRKLARKTALHPETGKQTLVANESEFGVGIFGVSAYASRACRRRSIVTVVIEGGEPAGTCIDLDIAGRHAPAVGPGPRPVENGLHDIGRGGGDGRPAESKIIVGPLEVAAQSKFM